jgi:hypothetical protein
VDRFTKLTPTFCFTPYRDPQIQKDFVEALYDGGPFLRSLPNALSENGIFVGQVGQAPSLKDPLEDHSLNRNRVKFIQSLIDLGFLSILDYEEVCEQRSTSFVEFLPVLKLISLTGSRWL